MDSLEAKANFSRVCQLLIDKGGVALKGALHAVHPPATLAAALNANKTTLKKIRYSVIKPPQWDLLFPASGSPDSNNFDITLLTILLRNICGLPSPPTGWNDMPPASDTSVSADILRIKMFRNEVYGHIPTAQYEDTTFEKLWNDISKPLVKLGILQQDIDELKEAPLSPEEEMYIEKLKEWKELEDNVMAKISDVDKKVENLTEEFVKQREALANAAFSKVNQLAKFDFTGKIDDLCKKFQVGTREWFFDRLCSWFTDEKSGVMILTAGPGIGKSVLAAKVCELYKQRGQLAAWHFCNVGIPDSRNPYKILQSLASQMCDNVDGFRDKLAEALRREHSRDTLPGAFRVLLNDPLHSLERHEPLLIVVDALDESKTAEKSEFLELIKEYFHELPKWVKILITSRPELRVKEELHDLKLLEILPDNRDHNNDVEYFIRCCLPNLDEGNVSLLVMSECEGSFLYAFYIVKDLKERTNMGIEPNLSKLIPRGMSGFYKKQFERLRTGLQHFNIDIVKSGFINVIAASREPLPIQILLKCMDVSDEKYEVRDSIVNIMSEILPIYDDCLTIYHKSLLDWLTLKGYKEHAFVADIADGNKRLWHVCKSIYSDVDVLVKSASEFQITPDMRYALANGRQYLLNVAHTDDFHWLVNVDLNFLKLKIFGNMKVDLRHILTTYKSKLPDDLYWRIFQTHAIMEAIRSPDHMMLSMLVEQKLSYSNIYLQSLSNGIFNFRKDTLSDQNRARNILQERNEVWIEEVTNGGNSNFTVISNAVINGRRFKNHVSSPDKKLLAWLVDNTIKVFTLPCLTMIFELKTGTKHTLHRFIIFSPDSSYLLYDSVKSCVMIREQKQVPFIPHSPEFIKFCSFSSCGMKLMTTEDDCIKEWDLKTRDLLRWIPVDQLFFLRCGMYSKCNAYICGQGLGHSELAVWDSTTLEQLDSMKICVDSCLKNQDNIQFMPKMFSVHQSDCIIETGHFHLPNGKIVLPTKDDCLEPFAWKDRKCLGFINLSSSIFSLVVYDFIDKQVVDLFQIGGIPSDTSIQYISNLDEKNFLISLNSSLFVLSFESAEYSVAPFLINQSAIRCSALSPSNLYFACCYYNRILAIRKVDYPDILQIVKLKHSPEACWWSELYLWVVCKGTVVKFPYDSTHKNLLGKCLHECDLNFEEVLKFAHGVLVIRINKEISILKICDERLCPQEIPDPTFAVSCLAISSDGCAVLLYRKSLSDYQLWEKAGGNRWE